MINLGTTRETGRAKLVRIADRNMAVGAAARLMMTMPAYQGLRFGAWMRALDAQADRGHQLFAIDVDGKLVGYLGYAHATEAAAEAWLAGSSLLSSDCTEGDCVIFNAFVATDSETLRAVRNGAYELMVGKKFAFYKRSYGSEPPRAVRLAVTKFVARHIERARTGGGGRS